MHLEGKKKITWSVSLEVLKSHWGKCISVDIYLLLLDFRGSSVWAGATVNEKKVS